MYLARFSYDALPIHRQRAIDFIRREVEAAHQTGLSARLLVPLTRSHCGAALQFEVELTTLDELDQFRQRGVGSGSETASWMHSFSEILVAPYTIVRPGWFDYNGPDEHRLVLLQGDTRHAGNPSDGVIARCQIAEVLVRSLSSDHACTTRRTGARRSGRRAARPARMPGWRRRWPGRQARGSRRLG
jgi:hypothetical protein